MKKRFLLLGGTGAMGRNLSQILSRHDVEIFVTSRKRHDSDKPGVHYLVGNAKDMCYLKSLANENFDCIVDFMAYSTDEFRERYLLLLSMTKQYVFISSARVYAESKEAITENTPRLLDVCVDKEYLKTDEYALAKARQEDLLFNSEFKNWTIIRPSITFDTYRLQLGVMEKESWLYRAIHGRKIVFSKDIACHVTTNTSGYDVAEGIASIMGNPKALREVFNITCGKSYKWSEILDIYIEVLTEYLHEKPKVVMVEKCPFFAERKYQIIYSRYFDRHFDNSKIKRVMTRKFTPMKDDLCKALKAFLENPIFGPISIKDEAKLDRLSSDWMSLNELHGYIAKVEYLIYRFIKSNRADRIFNIFLHIRQKILKIKARILNN
ncbi:MAG: NAD(P)H-binding protein [Bacillota bacterium]